MRTKFFSILLVGIMVLIGNSYAQSYSVDTSIIRKYNSSLVNEVYDVISKTNISPEKQKDIVGILRKQDSVIALMISQNMPGESIDSVNAVYTKQWKAYLSSVEQLYYAVEKERESRKERYTYEFLLLVLKNESYLEISDEQTAQLKGYIDSLKIMEEAFLNTNPEKEFNSFPFEKKRINTILNDNQFMKLMEIKSKDNSYMRAKKDAGELLLRGIVTGIVSEEQIKDFADFYVTKDYAYTRYENNPARKEYLRKMYETQPVLLRKLYYSRKSDIFDNFNSPTTFSQFMLAIQNKTTLNLTSLQIDSLGFFSEQLIKIKYEQFKLDSSKKFDSRAYESLHLNRLLTNNQYRQLLIIKNSSKAKNFALNDWREIEERGLATNYSKDTAILELTNFYIARECIYDRYEYSKVRQATLITAIYANKPQALKALLHARRNPANNTIGQGYQW